MTQDLVILKPVKEIYKYIGVTCKIPNCEKPARSNYMCKNHDCKVRDGIINEEGERIGKRNVLKWPRDFGCIVCDARGKIVKGFCKSHYEQFRKGILLEDGSPGRERKRMPRYGEYDFCKAEGCSKRPRIRGWCESCFDSYKRGTFNENGMRLVPKKIKNKGLKCIQSDCDREAHAKGKCHLHYWRDRLGYLGEERKNDGPCIEEGCERKAYCRSMCSHHYYQFMKENKRLQSVDVQRLV